MMQKNTPLTEERDQPLSPHSIIFGVLTEISNRTNALLWTRNTSQAKKEHVAACFNLLDSQFAD